MKSRVAGNLDQEVKNFINEPEDYSGIQEKLLQTIESKQKSIQVLQTSIKSLKFQHFLNKLSRRARTSHTAPMFPSPNGPNEQVPLLYIVLLSLGLSLFIYSILHGIIKDPKFALA